MDVLTDISFTTLTTMKLGGAARLFAEVRSADELPGLWKAAQERNLPVFIIGGGSNTIARDEGFAGLVIRVRIPGFAIVDDDLYATTITVGAGENWDEFVRRTVELRLTGVEALSSIPGTCGAAPVQNIGAYGQEVSDTLQSLQAYDTQTDTIVTLQAADCGFRYRHSIFRGDDQGRYIITSLTFKLSKNLPQPPFYDALQNYLDGHAITTYSHQAIRDAVIAIRADKLPDPKQRPNSGSFFKNAIVEKWQADELVAGDPTVKVFEMTDGQYKIPTGWLIEHSGLKGKPLHGMRIHDKNALVLINESATSYADLAAARDEIIGAVRDKYRIIIEQEPLEV